MTELQDALRLDLDWFAGGLESPGQLGSVISAVAVGLGLPWERIAVNLAPADLPKEGSHFDLPIALALMAAMGALSPDAIQGFAAIGELGLDGSIRDVPGALPASIGANSAGKGLICSKGNGPEAAWAGEHVPIVAAEHLVTLINHFKGAQVMRRPEPRPQRSGAPGALRRMSPFWCS